MSDSGRERAQSGGQDEGFVKEAFAKIADRYVMTNHVLSVGTDILWRKKVGRMVRDLGPKSILDVATGTGDLALELQRVCPDARLVATDFCPEMLAHAGERGVKETAVADALALPYGEGEFDLVSAAFGLRNMADWKAGLREMGRVARGGHVLVLDFSLPKGVLRRPYAFYLNRVLPKVAGVLTGEGQAYEYLAGTIEKFPCGEGMVGLFEECGLAEVRAIPLSGGIASVYLGRAL
ncbi:MAG: ubiquinone/menaquinone biosynthesis methyltransferase [Verrucomicrobiota bacterium]